MYDSEHIARMVVKVIEGQVLDRFELLQLVSRGLIRRGGQQWVLTRKGQLIYAHWRELHQIN